ncbi:MAG: ribonuclease [Candidatus Binatota bacterium]|nr:ribonuclease [Candidatus Binatota bacterium]
MPAQDPEFVDTVPALAALGERLAGARELAIDTEFIRERTYAPRLELVQLATRDGRVALIDYGTLGRVDGDPLAAICADPSVLKVFHAAEQDLEMLALLFGRAPEPIWDTQLAAGLFGYTGRLGYSAMVEALLGERPATGEAYTEWSRRPLAPEQIRYAAADVAYLLALHDAERARLGELGRVSWAEEECAELGSRVERALGRRADAGAAHQRVRGWQRLDRRKLAILRELAEWREREAARRNRPAPRIARDDLLIEIARRAPARPAELSTLRGLPAHDLQRHGDALVEAVRRGSDAPREEWPEAAAPAPEIEESEAPLVPLLLAVLQSLALERRIAPALLATTADVQRLVLAVTRGESLDGVRLVRGWRDEAVGGEIRALLEGRSVVAWDGDRRRLRIDPRG